MGKTRFVGGRLVNQGGIRDRWKVLGGQERVRRYFLTPFNERGWSRFREGRRGRIIAKQRRNENMKKTNINSEPTTPDFGRGVDLGK